MRHSWILDVLRDLRSYGEINDLPAIAAAAAQAFHIAEAELALAQRNNGNALLSDGAPAE